jgi:hypothetical protein
MDVEIPQNPEQTRETIFQNWLLELKGRLWLNPDVMPEGVYEAVQTYKHFNAHRGGREKEADEKMEESAANFEKLTGYSLQDFVKYQDGQNEKLKDKK